MAKRLKADSTADEVEQASKDARPLVLAAIGAGAYCVLSAYSVRDCELLSGSGSISLPVLDAKVPLDVFFASAPFLLCCFFLYVYVDLHRIVVNAGNYTVEAWPLSEVPARPSGEGMSLSVLTHLAVWGTLPCATLLLSFRAIPLGQPALAVLNVLATTIACALSFPYWWRTWTKSSGTPRWLSAAAWVTVGLGVGLAALMRVVPASAFRAHYSDFKGAEIGALNLADRDMRQADFQRAYLSQAVFDRADLSGARFMQAALDYATFCGATLGGASFRGAVAHHADFRCGTGGFSGLSNVDFADADLREIDLSQSVLEKARGAKLSNAVLWQARLQGCDLARADVSGTNFTEVYGEKLNLEEAQANAANFFKGHLQSARFGRARLDQANFTAADLRAADFGEAILTRAKLAGADLQGANFQGSQLVGADVTETTNFAGARFDHFTQFSAGFDPTKRGMVCTDCNTQTGAAQ